MTKALMAVSVAVVLLNSPAIAQAGLDFLSRNPIKQIESDLQLLRDQFERQRSDTEIMRLNLDAERLERKQDRQFDDLMRAIPPRLPPTLPPPLHNDFDLDKMMREAAEADRLRVGPLPSVGLYGGDPISVGPGYVAPLIGR